MIPSHTIRLFLDSVGRSEEYEYYLGRFQSPEGKPFALLCPDLDSLLQAGDVLHFHIHFLDRIGLRVVVLLSGPCSEEMERLLTEQSPVYVPVRMDQKQVPPSQEVERELQEGRIPLLIYPRTGLPEALDLALQYPLHRLHFIRARGAFRSPAGETVNYCPLLQEESRLAPEDRPLFSLVKGLKEGREELHVSVTSPPDLLKEIFTVKGAGTVIRRRSAIHHFTDRSLVDEARLVALLRRSFGRELKEGDLAGRIRHFYLEENYRAAALLETTDAGLYLSKFAVDTQVRGEGVAQEIWNRMMSEHETIFWRSRRENSINRWYARLADGMHSAGPWAIFWKGAPVEEIPRMIRYCLERPEDFRGDDPR